MSLINDALKKAQKQRTGETPSLASMPSVGGETPHRIAKRAKPAGFDTLVIRAGIGAGVLLVVVVGGYFALREKPETGNLKPENSNAQTAALQPTLPAAQNPAPASPLPAQNTQVSSPAIGQATAGGFSPQVSTPAQPAFTLPVAPKPEPVAQAPASDPQVSGFRSQVSAAPASVPSPALTGSDPRVSPFRAQTPPPAASPQASSPTPQTSAAQASAVPPKLEPRAIQYIENIKVAGIMARPTDSKVLMNDRVYRIGSLVEAEMGLTLVGITSNSLTFEDGNGGRYTRTF